MKTDVAPVLHEVRFFHVGPLRGAVWKDRGVWFRVWGWGLHVEKHIHRPMFSERYGLRRGLHISFHPHDKPWCLKFLRPDSLRRIKEKAA